MNIVHDAPKAIETAYNGYRFRSRLEARWAVFFDAMGITYEYEKEGFELPSGRYLPDFWLPQVKMWAEVKAQELNTEEQQKAFELYMSSDFPVLQLVGIPDSKAYVAEHTIGMEDELNEVSYCLVNQYLDENRFYCGGWDEHFQDDDVSRAVNLAKSARFEHGESGTK